VVDSQTRKIYSTCGDKGRSHDFKIYKSLCHKCYFEEHKANLVESKVISRDNKVYLRKNCLVHGTIEALVDDDLNYYLDESKYLKPTTISHCQTKVESGCPFDCGLCTDHEQHTCIGLLEITQKCNLNCPVCFASSGARGEHLPLKKVKEMIDFLVESENGNQELVQISGGEPTIHPDLIEIIRYLKQKGVKHVMLNSNGLVLANDESLSEKLAEFDSGFEVLLQFDGKKKTTGEKMRGKDILPTKIKALGNMQKYGVPVTLLMTIENGVNEDELGSVFSFGLEHKAVRGIIYQPVGYFGRLTRDPKDRVTISTVHKLLEEQTNGMLKKTDFIPLPCNPSEVSFTYLIKRGQDFLPITRSIDAKKYLFFAKNTFIFYPESVIKEMGKNLFEGSCCNLGDLIKDAKKLFPRNYLGMSKTDKRDFIQNETFRISVSYFQDAFNFDTSTIKRECLHVITPEFKKIPFSTYNMFYRDKWKF